MAKCVHAMIRVVDEQAALRFYREALGMVERRRVEMDTFALIYLQGPESPFQLELTINRGRDQPYVQGDAYGHLAVTVSDIETEHRRMSALGISPGDIKDFVHRGTSLGKFFFIKDPDGNSIEVIGRNALFD